MATEFERKNRAGQIATQLMTQAQNMRLSGRWAQGAAVLEGTAQDMIVNASHPEQREARRIQQNLRRLTPQP